jgi:hypothetical protein
MKTEEAGANGSATYMLCHKNRRASHLFLSLCVWSPTDAVELCHWPSSEPTGLICYIIN